MDRSIAVLHHLPLHPLPLPRRPLPQRPTHAALSAAEPEAPAYLPPHDPAPMLMRVLDEIDYGLMLVDGLGRVRFANHAATRECARAEVIEQRDGLVRMCLAADQAALQKALEAAGRGARSLLRLAPPSQVQMVAVVPLEPAVGASTLLVFGKTQVCQPISMEFFAQSYRLSNAERSVLRGLCSGLRPGQIALEAGVAVSTVRTQIGSIRAKTATRSIRDLISRVTSLPPIVPVLQRPAPRSSWTVEGHGLQAAG
jgi:DNA-binding CsgD family transcriptional regulator